MVKNIQTLQDRYPEVPLYQFKKKAFPRMIVSCYGKIFSCISVKILMFGQILKENITRLPQLVTLSINGQVSSILTEHTIVKL